MVFLWTWKTFAFADDVKAFDLEKKVLLYPVDFNSHLLFISTHSIKVFIITLNVLFKLGNLSLVSLPLFFQLNTCVSKLVSHLVDVVSIDWESTCYGLARIHLWFRVFNLWLYLYFQMSEPICFSLHKVLVWCKLELDVRRLLINLLHGSNLTFDIFDIKELLL